MELLLLCGILLAAFHTSHSNMPGRPFTTPIVTFCQFNLYLCLKGKTLHSQYKLDLQKGNFVGTVYIMKVK